MTQLTEPGMISRAAYTALLERCLRLEHQLEQTEQERDDWRALAKGSHADDDRPNRP